MPREPQLLPIRVIGDDILRRKAQKVEEFGQELLDFAADLTHTMYVRDGVGLAAPQTGSSRRVLVMDPYWSREGRKREPIVMVNPAILESEGLTEPEEGCISLPGIYADVVRPSKVTVSYSDPQGNSHTLTLEGFPAVVFQHEYDHLEGVLFIDRLSTIARLKLRRKVKELESKAVDGVNIRGEE